MSAGPFSVFSGQIASGASTVSFDLGRGWKFVSLDISTMSTAMAVNVYAAPTAAGTYRQVYNPPINSATVITNPFVISAVVGTAGGVVQVPVMTGLRYVQVRTTGVVSGGVSISVYCN